MSASRWSVGVVGAVVTLLMTVGCGGQGGLDGGTGGGATGGGGGATGGGGGATGGGGGATGGGGGATGGGGGGHHHEGDLTHGRLAVGFADAGVVTVIDLDDRSTSTLPVSNSPSLYAAPQGLPGLFYAVQRTANQTEVMRSGVTLMEHDGHYHISKTAPTLLPSPIAGAMPTHFVHHGGWTVLFNDGDGTVDYVRESELLSNMTPRRAATGRAHHGVALVHGDRLVATQPDPNQLPDGGYNILPHSLTDRALASADTVIGTHANCPDLHGEHTEGNTVAFGCSDGVLLLDWNQAMQRFDSTKLMNPASVAGRVGTVKGHPELPVFIGNYDLAPDNGLAIINPATSTISMYPLPTRRFAFEISMHGDRVLVLTMDGLLHRLALDATRTTFTADGPPLAVIPPFASWPSTPRPTMAVGWEHAYVSDPRDGTVKEVSVEGVMSVAHTFSLGAAPSSLAITSVSPDWHDH